MKTLIEPTRFVDFIRDLLPWAHGHQIKAIATFVIAIIEKQTGNQAELARPLGNKVSRHQVEWTPILESARDQAPT